MDPVYVLRSILDDADLLKLWSDQHEVCRRNALKYVQYVNEVLRHIVAAHPVQFCLDSISMRSVLAVCHVVWEQSTKDSLNTQNSENSWSWLRCNAQWCFGCISDEANRLPTLGIDQLANTYNILRQRSIKDLSQLLLQA